jgi:hypothetical protein
MNAASISVTKQFGFGLNVLAKTIGELQAVSTGAYAMFHISRDEDRRPRSNVVGLPIHRDNSRSRETEIEFWWDMAV